MIDISLYQRKLELAKEWLFHKIDGTLPMIGYNETMSFVIDVGCIPKISWDEAISIYEQTGVLFLNAKVPNSTHPATFEEYCEYSLIKLN